jgi:hypothetical protein
MLQTPTDNLCVLSENGFEICGIFQGTPLLKEFCESEGITVDKLAKNGIISFKGFREEMLNESRLRPFFIDEKEFPGEYRPFFSILYPALNRLEELIQEYHSQTPIKDLLLDLKISNTKIPSDIKEIDITHLQILYVTTGVKLIEKIGLHDTLYDAWSVLGEFYYLEGLWLGLKIDQEFIKNLPSSDICPRCKGQMKYRKNNRSSEICKKCRDEIKIERQRQRRGIQFIGERYCDCGCGEIITGRPNKKYVNGTHGRRKQKR